MKRILFVAPFDGVSGGVLKWAENIYDYYKSIKNNDYQIIPFSIGRSRFVNINQSIFLRLYYALLDYVGIIKRFSTNLKKHKYDIIHIASSASISLIKDIIMAKIAQKYKSKIIIHFHFGRIPQLITQKNWEYKLLMVVVRNADAIIVIDKLSYDTLTAIGITNVWLLPNPLSNSLTNLISSYNGHVNIVPNKILFVGHVVKTKGVFELVKACAQIPNISLYLIGYVEPEIKTDLINLSNHAPWLNIIGEKPYEDIIRDMMSCDIFVLPTYTEGFPNVILESMACGCAIIASAVGAIPEMLTGPNNEKCGLLISPQNIDDIKNSIIKFIDNPKLKLEYRTNAKNYVKRYSMPIIWKEMCSIWANYQQYD